MTWLLEPFAVVFVQRALLAGILAALLCAVAGTWIVLRGMAFLGDAMSHGMLPGVAVATLLGFNPLLGAAVSAAVMAAGMSAASRSRRMSQDTAIGLLFAGMLALGVMIISRSGSFAVDLTGILFGDILAVRPRDLAVLAAALLLTGGAARVFQRAFTAAAFDVRKAATLGLRPRLAHGVLMAMMITAISASFQVVGTLLVFGLLIAPPAAARLWTATIPAMMLVAGVIGSSSVAVGLLVSWHASTAAGATITAAAVLFFFLSAALQPVINRLEVILRLRRWSTGDGRSDDGIRATEPESTLTPAYSDMPAHPDTPAYSDLPAHPDTRS